MADDSAPTIWPPKRGQTPVSRRNFVKGAMGAATLGALGAGGFGVLRPVINLEAAKTEILKYFGAKKVDGPAPRGVPIIPVQVNAEGFIEGKPTRLEWYQYCGHEGAPGLYESFTGDNVFRYFLTEEKIVAARAANLALWFEDKIGDPIRFSDLDEVGKGAAFRWRSEGQTGVDIITGIVIRVDPKKFKRRPDDELWDPVNNLVALSTYCTHFCCVPGFKESNIALKLGYWEKMLCTCHFSVYDPYNIVRYEFEHKIPGGEEE